MAPPKIQGSSPVVTAKPIAAPPPPELSPTGKALKALGTGEVSGKSMADLISKQAKGEGLSAKFAEIKKFVDANKNLSPEAKKVFEVFKGQVELAKANRQDSVDFRSANKMDRQLQAAARPVDVNAKLPETKETPEVEGYGKANGKADLGDKLKYGNMYMSEDKKDAWSLKETDLDPTVGDYTVGKAKTPVHSSPLKITSGQLDDQLKTKFPGGVTFKPPFKDNDSREAVIAKNALINASNTAERGAENDLIVNTGTKGSPKPTTMTTKTDKTGAVTVEFGSTVPATKANFKTLQEAKDAFKKDFGMDVSDPTNAQKKADPGLKDWDLTELNKMHDGLSQMNKDEKKALDGVTLERRTNVPGHPDWVAEFSPDTGHDPKTKEPVRKDKMIIANGTFDGDKGQFVGDLKNPQFPSVRTVLHEAGHAVENKSQREAHIKNEQAKFNYNEAIGPHAKVSKSWDGAYGKLKGADKDAAKDFNTAYKDVETKRAALAASKPADVTANYDALMKAQNKLTDEYNKLPAGNPAKKEAGALRDSAANMGLLYAKNVADTGKTLSEKQKLDGKENISAQQQKFDKYVKDNGIPEITDYAVKGSRHENYAEAFSLYKTDPQWMKENAPKLYDYFSKGEHLKD